MIARLRSLPVHLAGSLGLLAILVAVATIESSPASMLTLAAGVGAALIVVTLLRVAAPHLVVHRRGSPHSAVDISVLLAQSDPDAAGHPRPRAPGLAASAA